MNERKAGGLANKIYAAVKAGKISPREALKLLDPLVGDFSYTQFGKYHEFSHFYRENPWFLDKKA
jgi:hypothetical protein